MDANSPYHPDNMTKRREDLRAQEAEILARATPIREQRDRMVQEHERARAVLDEQLRNAESGLSALQEEIAFLNVNLGGHHMVVTG